MHTNERDGALQGYHQVLSPTRQIVKARDERKGKTADKRTKLHLLYKEGQKVAASAQAADVVELSRRRTKFDWELEKKKLQMQTLPG